MTHRLTTNYAKNYCNQTLIVKVVVENVFWGHSVQQNDFLTFNWRPQKIVS